MKLKLVKIVYGYDIDRDRIAARQTFVPAAENEPADMIVEEDMVELTQVIRYTTKEWEDLLYKLKAQPRSVDIKKVAEELTG